MARPCAVAICACTYRRPDGLRAMLDGLGRQTFSARPRPTLHVVIADNEGSDAARAVCAGFEQGTGVPVIYVHEPRRGISHARNACLDAIPEGFEFFAFIDDDEIPDPDWLERLIEAQASTGADVVQGAVVPVFPEGTPEWLITGQFFARPGRTLQGDVARLEEHEELDEAGAGNVLVRTATVKAAGLRFDPNFGLSGGEDTVFFRALRAAGNRIAYAPRAIVRESLPRERATLWYRLKREYRTGISPLSGKSRSTRKIHRRVRNLWRDGGGAMVLSGLSYLAGSCLSGRLSMDRFAIACLRIARGAGQCARRLGLRYYIYR